MSLGRLAALVSYGKIIKHMTDNRLSQTLYIFTAVVGEGFVVSADTPVPVDNLVAGGFVVSLDAPVPVDNFVAGSTGTAVVCGGFVVSLGAPVAADNFMAGPTGMLSMNGAPAKPRSARSLSEQIAHTVWDILSIEICRIRINSLPVSGV